MSGQTSAEPSRHAPGTDSLFREGEETFRTVFLNAPFGMCLIGLDGAFLSANSAFCRMIGYTESELRARTIRDVTHEDDIGSSTQLIDRLRVPDVGSLRFEKRYRHKQGHVVWAALQSQLLRDPDGSPRFFITHAEDVTERRQADDTLRESDEKFRIAFENAPMGMSMIRPDGRYLAVNPALCQMFGYTAEELLSGTINVVTHPDDVERSTRWIKQMIAGDNSEPEFEKRYLHRDGHVVWGLVRARWIRNLDGTPRFSVVHILDITERKEAQEALLRAQKLEAIGLLAGGVAHDFNNLLTVIGGNASCAIEELRAGDPLHVYLTDIGQAVDSAANLTRQLLAFSRKQIIAPRILDLNGVIAHLAKMLRRLLGEDIDLTTVLDERLGHARLDAGQLEHILVNLSVNARDAMRHGGRLTIETGNVALDANYCSTHAHVAPGEFVMLAVSDNGEGMTEDVKRRIFEPFFTTKQAGQGTGLGLAMVYGAVRQNGGHVEVYSELGHGTTFKLYFPRVHGDVTALPTPSPSCRVGGTETIVLVEDNSQVRTFAHRLLSDYGYSVHAFTSGDEALQTLQDATLLFHLLVTDIVMPGINGKVLADALRVQQPDLKVLFTSGYTENVIVHHGVLTQDVEFIAKPYTAASLTAKVRAVLDREPVRPLEG